MSGFGLERMYDESETAKIRFVGFVSDENRYDIGVVYTNQFFGKPLVICMQTGRSTTLCAQEAKNISRIMDIFSITSESEATHLSEYFQKTLPSVDAALTQY
jgi:hypothetical protein